MSSRSNCCLRPTMRVFEMVGSELVTTPTVSIPARSRMLGQFGLLRVAAPEAGKKGLAAEAGEVHRDVGCATGALVPLRMAEDRDRSLGRDALDVAVDVAVEHDVADDEDLELAEAAFEQVQDRMKILESLITCCLVIVCYVCDLRRPAFGNGCKECLICRNNLIRSQSVSRCETLLRGEVAGGRDSAAMSAAAADSFAGSM